MKKKEFVEKEPVFNIIPLLDFIVSTILLGYKENGKNWDHWVSTL